ncbi:MAG: triose-phosphate isomerase [Candidatus Eisenbacteria bacterium]|uniref:Triosephosphate isomerase n=1 Tax=Eiseniibacteriota bacterium TaxID=2212470 RepID=A0A538UEN1_UNCEI|nr:MAG: triose-phosphate isomerase [Candidatus Eisenbacteria bacterium]
MARPWPRQPRLIAGNWKMNKTAQEGSALAGQLKGLLGTTRRCEIALCPPYPALESVAAAVRGSGIHLGAQDLHPEPKGAFTGAVSGPMLSAVGCRFVIVGHSERRHGMGEDDALVARKARAALRDGLTPIVCVGETLSEREAGGTADVLVRQVRAVYEGLGEAEARATVVAYEPVWAIGTGKVASLEQAREAHQLVRATLDRVVAPGLGQSLAVLYGGSVNAENAAALFGEAELDGALVGGASLEAAGFWRICAAATPR